MIKDIYNTGFIVKNKFQLVTDTLIGNVPNWNENKKVLALFYSI